MSSLPPALCKKKAEGKRNGEGSRGGKEGRREQISLLFPTILHSEVDVEAVILPQLISGDLKQNVKPARCTRAIGSLLIDWHPQETHRWTPSSWRTPPCEFLKSKPSFLCLLPAASHPTPPPIASVPRFLPCQALTGVWQALTLPLHHPAAQVETGKGQEVWPQPWVGLDRPGQNPHRAGRAQGKMLLLGAAVPQGPEANLPPGRQSLR